MSEEIDKIKALMHGNFDYCSECDSYNCKLDHEHKRWQTGKPKTEDVFMLCGSDYMGEYQFIAEWVKYKNDKKGNGRWMKRNERKELRAIDRKELPDKFRRLTKDEFMQYYDLGEEDMINDQ